MGSSALEGTPLSWKTTSMRFLDPLEKGLTVNPLRVVVEKYSAAFLVALFFFFFGGGFRGR